MLDAAAHEARMREVPEGAKHSTRALLEGAAARGSVAAQRELDGPDRPETLEYIWHWFEELDRTRTVNGTTGHLEPLTYPTIESWARLTGRNPTPLEVDAMMSLDVAIRFPDAIAALSNG